MALTKLKEHRCFDGLQQVYRHNSAATGTSMEFSVFLPPAVRETKVPVVYYLSGLTCTWENATTKGAFQRHATDTGLAVVCPDTSPRGTDLPGEHDSYDFGSSAGFYVDATQPPWRDHYRMYSYVTDELPRLVNAELPVDGARAGIFGHSMGGHGALVCALRNPEQYKSVSAFAPVVAPTQVPWGEKAFGNYLGADRRAWRAYDASCLITDGARWPSRILIDQGTADGFLEDQLRPELLADAAKDTPVQVHLRFQDGYDHSYFFIATFMGDHIHHHARLLRTL